VFQLAPLSRVAVVTESATPPFLVSAVVEKFGLTPEIDWFLICGQGDDLARGAFVLFPPADKRPRWVAKFARAPGYGEPFDRDERGLGIVAKMGGVAAARAPQLIGRFEAGGFQASLETAGVGSRLSGLLGSAISTAAKQRIVETIASWLIEMAVETRGRFGSNRAEVERLRRDVLPRWQVSPEILDGLDALPGVLQHNDLGAWNIVSDGEGFTALDWESAQPAGLPLWDLWYFLADALHVIDGRQDDAVSSFRMLFRGEAPSSPLLFRHTRAAVAALRIPEMAVGRLACLCWLHHGLSHASRARTLDRHSPVGARMQWPTEAYPHVWLEDRMLGPGWSRWLES
jgi:hypothetical protein